MINMKQNKLILFDWGNIVESHTTGYSAKNAWIDLFKDLGYEGNDIFEKLGNIDYAIHTLNKLEETYNEIKKEFNLKTDFKQFIDRYNYFFDKIDYYQNVRDYELSLKDKCYVVR